MSGTREVRPDRASAPSGQRIVSISALEVDGSVRAITETGEVINVKRPVRGRAPGSFDAMSEPLHPLRSRAPMKVNRRPGRGGLQRTTEGWLDPTEGLEQYGEIFWWGVAGGATVGLLELDPAGNTVALCRLSSEERDERLVDQLRPSLAIAKQNELSVRVVLFAVRMSGTREVRPDRASAPHDGTLEREDMLELDKYIRAGWVEHIVARGGDRIARDILPGETLLKRWARNGIALWLSDFGRRMNYANDPGDRMLVRTMMMISAEEREAVVLRLQRGQLNKAPLAGNGHLGPTRFGFIRDKKTKRLHEDPEQWPWILRGFELADTGLYLDGEGLSTRAVAEELAKEGCPFDHDRVRKILQDPIYATGEYTTCVHGLDVLQNPVQLAEPVPIDRFARVQDLMKLRRGRSNRTPIGEFAFNYVDCWHKQCMGLESKRGPARVKGYIPSGKKDEHRTYRHGYWVPDCCRSGGRARNGAHTWNRELLERPTFQAIRELANHPELLRQLQVAERHTVASSSARLSEAQRVALEHELQELEQAQDQAIDDWIESTRGAKANLGEYRALMGKFQQKIQARRRRLEMDTKALEAASANDVRSHEQHLQTFLEIMTVETPEDPFLRQMRARLFQRIVSAVIIDDSGSGPITITIEGHLVPEGTPLDAGNPVLASQDLLDAYEDYKNGKPDQAQKMLSSLDQVRTDLSELSDKSVSISSLTVGQALALPSNDALRAAIRVSLQHDAWKWGYEAAKKSGLPAWRLERRVGGC
jgi:DNA invertase Pin-like site-specific DNA recombinase